MKNIYPVFDAHCDTVTKMNKGENLLDCNCDFNFSKALEYSKGFTQVCAIWTDRKEWDPTERVNDSLKRFDESFAKAPETVLVKTKEDLDKDGLKIIIGIEGGEGIDGSLERMEELYNKGLRLVTLTWNNPNSISDTNVHFYPKGGLTEFGVRVVNKMNELGIMIDVSHISDKGFYDVAEISQKPFIASHSNSRALVGHPRNLTDDQFKVLISKRGVTGINFWTDILGFGRDIDAMLSHIEHFLELGGEDNIGFGSDLDGIGVNPIGIEGTQSYDRIIERMIQKNYSSELIEKICYKNFNRVFKEVL